MKKLSILFIMFFSSVLFANDGYGAFLDQQIKYVHQLNTTSSPQKIQAIIIQQKVSYEKKIDEIIVNQKKHFNNETSYNSKIYALEKMIKINKRMGSKYAVLRDEVKIKSYKLVMYQNRMLQNIFNTKNSLNKGEFSDRLNDFIAKNQLQNQEILDTDYRNILDIRLKSRILNQAQRNIKEFNALIEINKDMINYLYVFEDKIFQLKKYSNYNLAGVVLGVNSIDFVQKADVILHDYHLSVIKVLFIFLVVIVIYLIKTIVYIVLERYLLKIVQLKDYIRYILIASKRVFGIAIKIINVNIVVYIYNDFNNPQDVVSFFNILYILVITIFIYKLLNIFLNVHIRKIDVQKKSIKHEMVNIGVKILNSLVVLIGILIVLYIIGIDLTAVLSGLGIGGLAVALASKDSLANFFGTLSVLLSDVFSQGDWIKVGDNEGVVVEIGLRITTIRTFDNALISIPNATFANKEVVNWDKRTLGRRIKMKLGIKYDSKAENIKNAVNSIRAMLDKHPNIATQNTQHYHEDIEASRKLISKDDYKGVKRTLLVYLDEFSDSSINILIYCFTKSVEWEDWLETKEDVMYKIMQICKDNNIEFAFNSLSIYNENDAKGLN